MKGVTMNANDLYNLLLAAQKIVVAIAVVFWGIACGVGFYVLTYVASYRIRNVAIVASIAIAVSLVAYWFNLNIWAMLLDSFGFSVFISAFLFYELQ